MTFLGHTARKRFGQHWLKDESVLQRIVDAADINGDDRVLEVGPGRGALTEKLLTSSAKAVHAVELDRDLVAGLRKRFSDNPKFTLQEGDILSVPLISSCQMPFNKIVANIPYNITGPLLERFLGKLGNPPINSFDLLVLLLQKEVAERILANPGSKSFSALSVRIQLVSNCRSICKVPSSCFMPQPKVQSEVIVIEPLKNSRRLDSTLESSIELLLRKAFVARRKMLRNSLAGLGSKRELETLADQVGISLSQRPQELAPAKWVEMARHLNQLHLL